jgi:putative nucleotidyltransferase with HDIG domain
MHPIIPAARLLLRRLEEVNKELWILLSMFVIAGVLNFALTTQRMVLSLYVLPTLGSAYFYGRRHATLTAVGSALLVSLLSYIHPWLTKESAGGEFATPLMDLLMWACVLVLTGYLMGTLYEHKNTQIRELRKTYYGVLEVLRYFISNDKYTENHSYRVSVYATRIASRMNLSAEQIEDIHAGGLLHDIGKLQVGKDLLYKASRLTGDEYAKIHAHVPRGVEMLETVGGSLKRVLPIVLAHHLPYSAGDVDPQTGQAIPLAARIVQVADVYDSLTSDRPYRKAMSSFEAKDIILRGSGTEFHPHVVEAFRSAFGEGLLELPNIVV